MVTNVLTMSAMLNTCSHPCEGTGVLSNGTVVVRVDKLSELVIGVDVCVLTKFVIGVGFDMLPDGIIVARVDIFSDVTLAVADDMLPGLEIIAMATPAIPLEFVV